MIADRSKPNKPVRILVIDLDCCTMTYKDQRMDFLSQKVIDIAKDASREYAGFYVCTHRCFFSLGNVDSHQFPAYFKNNFYAQQSKNIQRDNLRFKTKFLPHNQLTQCLVDNFKQASGLRCFAVSTLDDVCLPPEVTNEPCGFAYENVLKKFEDELLAKNSGDLVLSGDLEIPAFKPAYPVLSLEGFDLHTQKTDKNAQLIQVAKHAASQFPDSLIELDYLDDALDLCQGVKHLPPLEISNVKIRSFRHCPDFNINADLSSPIATVCGRGWFSLKDFSFLKNDKEKENKSANAAAAEVSVSAPSPGG